MKIILDKREVAVAIDEYLRKKFKGYRTQVVFSDQIEAVLEEIPDNSDPY